MENNLEEITITKGTLLNVNLKCVPAELVDILGFGLINIPKFFDYKMLEECFKKTKHNKLKHILDLLEKEDKKNCIIRFVN